MSWQFWFFLILTLIRQVPHLAMEIFSKKKVKYSGGKDLTVMMYVLYFLIWVPALFQVFRKPPEVGVLLVISIVLLVLGVWIRFVSLATLKGYFASNIVLRENHKLIKKGVYKIIRHPIYLALILELTGMIGFSRVSFLTFPLIGMVAVIGKQLINEDKALREEFGEEAEQYQRDVPALIPVKWFKKIYIRL